MIEYQTRDAVTLIKTTIASSDDAPGGLFTNNSIVKPSTPDEEDKGKALQRRIAIYLLERRYIIKTTAFLVRATLAKGCAWKHVGKQLLEKMHPVEVPVAIIDTIRKGVVQGGGEIPNWISGKLALDLGDPNALYYEWEKQVSVEPMNYLGYIIGSVASYSCSSSTDLCVQMI